MRIVNRGLDMAMLMLILYYAKALPEAFKLMMLAAAVPQTDSAPVGAEIDTGDWTL